MTKIVDNIFDDIEPLKWYESSYYRVCRLCSDTTYLFQRLYQRLKYGFPLWQTWEFKTWCSTESVKRLTILRDNLNGYPCGLSSEEWENILDKMIWSFENFDKHIDPIYSEDYDHRYEVVEQEGSTLYKPMNKTGTIDRTPVEDHQKKVQEGLDLFAKYFQGLWD